MVFPMVKHPFVVGFLVAEFRSLEMPTQGIGQGQRCDSPEKVHDFSLDYDTTSWDIQTLSDKSLRVFKFTAEQRLNAINISRSLAMAYVMDQVDYEFLNLMQHETQCYVLFFGSELTV